MPKASNLDLKLLNLLPNSIDGFFKFALLCVGILIAFKIYEKKRWS